jgi:hypothetical protein
VRGVGLHDLRLAVFLPVVAPGIARVELTSVSQPHDSQPGHNKPFQPQRVSGSD